MGKNRNAVLTFCKGYQFHIELEQKHPGGMLNRPPIICLMTLQQVTKIFYNLLLTLLYRLFLKKHSPISIEFEMLRLYYPEEIYAYIYTNL